MWVLLPVWLGCSAPPSSPAAPPAAPPPIVEWHASLRLYSNELCEDVVVWADGRIEARCETEEPRRVLMTPSQMDRLFVLLSEVEFLRCDTLDERLWEAPVPRREPDLVCDVLLTYSPRPGLRRELRRSWEDGALAAPAFTRECSARLGALDGFFRELIGKD